MEISLRPITKQNWRECAMLKLHPSEEQFVAPTIWSIAEAQFNPEVITRAIYHGEIMVGFVMYFYKDGPDAADPVMGDSWQIVRFMIDYGHRGKGLGRMAMLAVIEAIRNASDQYGCDAVMLSYRPGNEVAARLYASLGFEVIGIGSRNQTIMRLLLSF
ncbi:MAG: GNAT family N-acetyltransferase [Thermomicrobiales bacterium]